MSNLLRVSACGSLKACRSSVERGMIREMFATMTVPVFISHRARSGCDPPCNDCGRRPGRSRRGLTHHRLQHLREHAGDRARPALVADQHERLRLVRQLAHRHIDETADAALELDVERRKKGNAIIKNGGVAHDLNGVGFDDRQRFQRSFRKCRIEVRPDRGRSVGDHQRIVDAVTEPDLPNSIILQRCGRIAFSSPYSYVLIPAYVLLVVGVWGEVFWLLNTVDIHQFISFQANVPLIIALEVATLAWYLGFNYFKFFTYHHGLSIYYQKLPAQLKDCFSAPPPSGSSYQPDNSPAFRI